MRVLRSLTVQFGASGYFVHPENFPSVSGLALSIIYRQIGFLDAFKLLIVLATESVMHT